MLEDKNGSHREQIGSSSNSFPPASQAIHDTLAYDNIKHHDSIRYYLALHIGNLVGGELIFVKGNFGILEVTQKAELAWKQKQQTLALSTSTSCSTDTMNVITGIIWRVKLYNPINCRNIQSTSSNIRAQQNAPVSIAELEKGGRTFLLLLFTLSKTIPC